MLSLNVYPKPFSQNGWVFMNELSGWGFEYHCGHLNFRYHACFEHWVPWHSGNYRVWIHSEMRTWHDKNIQSVSKVYDFINICRWYVPQKFSIADSVISELKLLTIRKLWYIFIYISNIFPRIFRWLEVIFLWGL